jgi:hypothetical protein
VSFPLDGGCFQLYTSPDAHPSTLQRKTRTSFPSSLCYCFDSLLSTVKVILFDKSTSLSPKFRSLVSCQRTLSSFPHLTSTYVSRPSKSLIITSFLQRTVIVSSTSQFITSFCSAVASFLSSYKPIPCNRVDPAMVRGKSHKTKHKYVFNVNIYIYIYIHVYAFERGNQPLNPRPPSILDRVLGTTMSFGYIHTPFHQDGECILISTKRPRFAP